MRYSSDIAYLFQLIEGASRLIGRDFSEILHLQASVRGADGFVERCFNKAEKLIADEIKANGRYRPNIISPNQMVDLNSKYTVIFTPISGVAYFSRALPHFSTLIALKNEELGEVVAAVVEMPATREVFIAEKGKGALYKSHLFGSTGDYRVKVREQDSLERSIICTNINGLRDGALVCDSPVMAACYLAAGRIDGAVFRNINQIDAVSSLIAKEAGAVSSNYSDLKILSSQKFTSMLIKITQENYVQK